MIAFAGLFAIAGCAQPRSTAVTAPTASAASTTADAGAVSTAGDTGAATDQAQDSGALAQFRACENDSECVAVDRVGCCHNGWKEAVAASHAEAYQKSFTCPQEHPMCPMYIVRDARVPLCDNATHLCTMTRPEDVPCGGFTRNKHECPAGLHCQLGKHPDVPGKCIAQP